MHTKAPQPAYEVYNLKNIKLMHTTVFKFEEGSPYINSKRPVGIEIHNRLLWQAMRLARSGKRIFRQGLTVYTPIPAYLKGPTILEVYWDFKSQEEYDV